LLILKEYLRTVNLNCASMPRKQRRQEPQAALSEGLPTYIQHDPRPKVRIELLCEGCILWLPDRNENETRKITCIRDSCCSGSELASEGYNHPVLVLKINQDGICSFAQVRTLEMFKISRVNKLQVTSKEQNSRHRRVRGIDRLPISHHGTTGVDETSIETLQLEEGSMNRQSYVKIEHIFNIDVKQLRTCSFSTKSKPSDTRLTRQSHEYLMRIFGLQKSGRWIRTESLIQACGEYKPSTSQAVPVQPKRKAAPSKGNRTDSAPDPDGVDGHLGLFGDLPVFAGLLKLGYVAANAIWRSLGY
jgi:hypothetical protein